jgi:SAM-dependent methyltransferase
LTWGAEWNGNSFIDATCKRFTFLPDSKIVELGPGYGRLLDTILERKLPFKSYIGVELSAARVKRLEEKYKTDSRIKFINDDIEKYFSDIADLVISSATFPHLFPNFQIALANILSNIKVGGILCFDLTEGPSIGSFHNDGITWARLYDKEELQSIFSGSNFGDLNFDKVVHGKDGVTGETIEMLFVSVIKLR